MDYQEIANRVREVLDRGGFSRDMPLDSVEVILSSDAAPISAREIGSYSSALAFVGEWDRAEAVARSIKDSDAEKGLALAILAQRLAHENFLDRAESVARSIPNAGDDSGYMVEKPTALLAIAAKFVAQNRRERALAVLEEAEVAIKHLEQPDHLLASLLGDLANLLHKTGQIDKANKFWDAAIDTARTSIETYRSGGLPDVDAWKALAIIAEDLFGAGHDRRAEEAIALIDNAEFRERARSHLRR